MKDKKFIPFWMEKSKIEIIEAYAECIHNGEVLLERIEEAIKYIKDMGCFDNECNYFCDYLSSNELNELLNILNGRIDE